MRQLCCSDASKYEEYDDGKVVGLAQINIADKIDII